ncbi:MAG: GSCFA domain-containing protein [Rhodospirillaceae bacterium]
MVTRYKNQFPSFSEDLSDVRAAIRNYILPGYVPEKPILAADSKILTLGSCFAENIDLALKRAGFDSTYLSINEVTNTPAFAHLLVSKLVGEPLGGLVVEAGPEIIPDEAIAGLRPVVPQATAFILTVGVALQPFRDDRPAFFGTWSPVTKATLLATSWRMLSVLEILDYIRWTVVGLRRLRPGIPIFLTLSPIPLTNAMCRQSAVAEDCVSKSRLRVAIDDLMSEDIEGLYYWPSFEIVRWLGGHVGPFFGTGGVDQRHVSPEILDIITSLFIESFFVPRA